MRAIAGPGPLTHSATVVINRFAAMAGDWAAALGRFQEAAAARPNSSTAWEHVGTAVGTMGRHGEAVDAFQRAVELDPRNLAARERLGTLLAAAGDARGAAEQFRAAVMINPGSPAAREGLARLHGTGPRGP